MLHKADSKAGAMLREQPLTTVNDLNQFMSGQTISYLELCQGLISSKHIQHDIYEAVGVTSSAQQNFDALKEIALEQAPQSLLNATQIKKTKAKKPKK
jgi:hypothetical protein